MKDIEWLKETLEERIDTMAKFEDVSYSIGLKEAYQHTLLLINQLDEPEVLSSDWIKDNQLMWTSIHGAEYYVPANKLYGKIVPKQEITEEQAWEIIHGKYGDEALQNNIDYVESQGYVVIEKPTVPQFVADWHVQNKYYLLGAKFERIADSEDKRVVDWYRQCSGRHNNKLSNAQETIALMDLVGYEVEEEPQYRLKAGENYLYFNLDGTVRGATKDNAIITKERLEQLPFDVDKAVESGIIEVEEMEEC